eukprot:3126264-Prymnesium_polylepis.1
MLCYSGPGLTFYNTWHSCTRTVCWGRRFALRHKAAPSTARTGRAAQPGHGHKRMGGRRDQACGAARSRCASPLPLP